MRWKTGRCNYHLTKGQGRAQSWRLTRGILAYAADAVNRSNRGAIIPEVAGEIVVKRRNSVEQQRCCKMAKVQRWLSAGNVFAKSKRTAAAREPARSDSAPMTPSSPVVSSPISRSVTNPC